MKALDTTKLTSLGRKVYGRNLINELTIKNLKIVIPILESLKGDKIKLSAGSRSKKLTSVIKYLNYEYNQIDGSQFRTYLKFSSGSVWLFQDVTIKEQNYISGGYGASYHKNDICIGTIDINGVLKTVDTIEQILYSYAKITKKHNVKKVNSTIEKIESLKEELRALQYSINDIQP